MCGICGYLNVSAEELGTIEKMTGSLSHRGPDAWKCWQGDSIALGHTRLAIIDLSDAGVQPMATADYRYQIVFNGEIYNYRELRRELEQEGETFRSATDTEVILLGFRRWGRGIVDRLRGMFAFALWDDLERHLFLARDRIGIKPLFYAEITGGLIFGSEIKALLAHPSLHTEMNPGAVDRYLALGYVPGPETIFQGIRVLMPGHWLESSRSGIRVSRYWAPDFTLPVVDAGEEELVNELDARLNEAVRSHLVADVPVGAFLSGGVDSSLVAAMARRNGAAPLHTFTIGFSGGGDERPYARAVAEHIGSEHHEELAVSDLVRHLPLLVRHLEQPLFDNSALPTFLVSKLARERVKVVVSGDGGDEPFAGYDWTRYALCLPSLPVGRDPSRWQWAYRSGMVGQLGRLAHDVSHTAEARYLRRITVPPALRHWLYQPSFLDELREDPLENLRGMLRTAPVRAGGDRFLHCDLCAYLPEDVLFKVDRMSMAHGLEVRVPLLDHELMEWVLRLPFSMRFRRGRGKYLLRRVAARYLPPLILKPRKQGFTIPMARWLREATGAAVEALFDSRRFAGRGIIVPQRALELLRMHRSGRFDLGHRIWSLAVLEVWARIWLDGEDFSWEEARSG